MKTRCLNVTSIRKVMIIGGGCVKPRCLNVTSMRKVMIKSGGCLKPRCLSVTSIQKGDDKRLWIRET